MDLMENRRLQGKAQILKKLRRNQDFLLSNELSPSAKVWTKWHEERVMGNHMDKDLSSAPNQRYIQIMKEITLPVH